MKIRLTLLLMIATVQMNAQEIKGMVLDEKKEPVTGAVVRVYQGGILKGGTVTDFDGMYVIKPLENGLYDMIAAFKGFDSVRITGATVSAGQATAVNFSFSNCLQRKCTLKEFVYKKPLIGEFKQPDSPVKIVGGPTISDIVAVAPGIYQRPYHTSGCSDQPRSSGNIYVIDSVQVPIVKIACLYGQVIPIMRSTGVFLTARKIQTLPYTDLNDIIAATTGFYQRQRGAEVSVFGSR